MDNNINLNQPIENNIRIKIEPNLEEENTFLQHITAANINDKSLPVAEAVPIINKLNATIKQELDIDNYEIERIRIKEQIDKLKLIDSGDETDEYADNRNDEKIKEKTTNTNKLEKTSELSPRRSKLSKRKRSSRSFSSSSTSSFSKKKSHYKSKKRKTGHRRPRSRSRESFNRERSNYKHHKDNRKDKHSTKRNRRSRSISEDKNLNNKTKLSATSTKYKEITKKNVDISSSSKLLNSKKTNNIRIVDYNHRTPAEIEKHTDNSELNNERSPHTVHNEHATPLAKLRPIIVKEEMPILPIKTGIQIKKEHIPEKSTGNAVEPENKTELDMLLESALEGVSDDDDDDDVRPPLPIKTTIKVEKRPQKSSKSQVLKSEDALKEGEDNCRKAIKQFKNFNNSNAKPFYFTSSKVIQPSLNKMVSPLLRSKQVYFSYSTSSVKYNNFGITSLSTITTNVAKVIGYDISQLINQLHVYEGNLSEFGNKLTSDISKESAYPNLMISTSTQTDMYPCIDCAYRRLQEPSQTNVEIPLIKKLQTANSAQIKSLTDYFELLSTFKGDRMQLRDMLLATFDMGQGQMPNSQLPEFEQLRILNVTPNQTLMYENNANNYVNTNNYGPQNQNYITPPLYIAPFIQNPHFVVSNQTYPITQNQNQSLVELQNQVTNSYQNSEQVVNNIYNQNTGIRLSAAPPLPPPINVDRRTNAEIRSPNYVNINDPRRNAKNQFRRNSELGNLYNNNENTNFSTKTIARNNGRRNRR